jgi:hypothetical protein
MVFLHPSSPGVSPTALDSPWDEGFYSLWCAEEWVNSSQAHLARISHKYGHESFHRMRRAG